MARAVLLIIGAATYLAFLNYEHNLAGRELTGLQQAYSVAMTQGTAVSDK